MSRVAGSPAANNNLTRRSRKSKDEKKRRRSGERSVKDPEGDSFCAVLVGDRRAVI